MNEEITRLRRELVEMTFLAEFAALGGDLVYARGLLVDAAIRERLPDAASATQVRALAKELLRTAGREAETAEEWAQRRFGQTAADPHLKRPYPRPSQRRHSTAPLPKVGHV